MAWFTYSESQRHDRPILVTNTLGMHHEKQLAFDANYPRGVNYLQFAFPHLTEIG